MGYSEGYPIRLAGGRLALDFLNTANWAADGTIVHEKLECDADLAAWVETLGLGPHVSLPTSREAMRLRGLIRPAFLGGPRADEAATRINGALRNMRSGVLPPSPARLADMVTVSAAAVLMDPREMARLKLCPGDNCGWLFLDETRNARRKWCLMETCGNRAKARRYYARTKASEAG